jgi:Tfp pilus assembly protein PilV
VKGRRGLSLIEAIISIFLMVAGFLIMAQLYHSALQYQSMVNDRTNAVTLAERQMESVRSWSRQVHRSPGGTKPFTDWTGCPGVPTSPPDDAFPGYTVTTTTAPKTLYSPCSQFESKNLPPYSLAQQRRLKESSRLVTVTVSWGNRQLSVVSLVTIPTGELAAAAPLKVSAGATIAKDAFKLTVANTTNKDNRLLNDVTYVWQTTYDVDAANGYTDITRDGRTLSIYNFLYAAIPDPENASPPAHMYAPGKVILEAIGRYRGRKIQGVATFKMQ